MSLAVANYHDCFGSFPPAYVADESGRPMHSWRILILPYLGQKALYDRYRFDEPWDGPHNRLLATEMPPLFAFAGTHVPGQSTRTNFVAVTGVETAWPGARCMTYDDITDGSANTVLFAEYNGAAIHWMEPRDLEFATMSFEPDDPRGISSQYLQPAVAFADGSTQRLEATLSAAEIRAMCTAAGRDVTPDQNDLTEFEDGRLRERKP